MIKQQPVIKIILAGLLIVTLSGPAKAEAPPAQTAEDKKVYRKLDSDGVVEFSDQPSKDAKELKVETLPTYKFTPVPDLAPLPKSRPARPAVSPPPYTALTINRPKQNDAIRSNNGDVKVTFSLAPNLRTHEGDMIEYILDGKTFLKTRQPQTLKNLDRGTHTLVIRIIDKNNNVLIHSDPVTFSVMRFFKPPASPAP